MSPPPMKPLTDAAAQPPGGFNGLGALRTLSLCSVSLCSHKVRTCLDREGSAFTTATTSRSCRRRWKTITLPTCGCACWAVSGRDLVGGYTRPVLDGNHGRLRSRPSCRPLSTMESENRVLVDSACAICQHVERDMGWRCHAPFSGAAEMARWIAKSAIVDGTAARRGALRRPP